MAEQSNTASERTLSVTETARILGVTQPTLRAWIARGRMVASRLPNGYWRIPRREVERLMGGTR